ncbi:MAG TPA: hypothetical protein VHO69_01675, partial [Phototrophicaceae bacterium]|nr:hypothetical protein [Phototrophicaceae bacterium]
MLEKLPITDEQIRACLQETYGLTVTEIEFLPLGYDAAASVYRVWADSQPYFLKVKAEAVNELSVRLPRYLQQHGLAQVV